MNLKDKIEMLHKTASDRLNAAVAKLPLETKKRALGTLGLCVATLCLVMMIRPFRSNTPSVAIGRDAMPVTIVPPEPTPGLSNEDRAFLRGFKDMMDSLKTHDPVNYTRVIGGREGLLDSVEMLLNIKP